MAIRLVAVLKDRDMVKTKTKDMAKLNLQDAAKVKARDMVNAKAKDMAVKSLRDVARVKFRDMVSAKIRDMDIKSPKEAAKVEVREDTAIAWTRDKEGKKKVNAEDALVVTTRLLVMRAQDKTEVREAAAIQPNL